MDKKHEYFQYLARKRRSKDYINKCEDMLNSLEKKLGGELPTAQAIGEVIKERWCGYVNRDKNTFQIFCDFADFYELIYPSFSSAFREFVRETFEGEARKAMKSYKESMVFIPANTKINPVFLYGLKNDEFVSAFKALQEFLHRVYDAIEKGSPFDWGWQDWNAITVDGINHNRVIVLLNTMVECGHKDNGVLVVDKKRFSNHASCIPMAKTRQLLEELMKMGLSVKGLCDKESLVFSVSFPDNPNIVDVLYSYFKKESDEWAKIRAIKYFSYRFVEDPATQTHETFFLAKTDGEPEHLREIYYWNYDEAIKHEFLPTGSESIYCYSFKKGSKEWLLLGKGSSYHEDEFLHSVDYAIAAKFGFTKCYRTHPEEVAYLRKRFPETFERTWSGYHKTCRQCKPTYEKCKNRVTFPQDNPVFYCSTGCLYFHDPTFDEIKIMLELYKSEKNIK